MADSGGVADSVEGESKPVLPGVTAQFTRDKASGLWKCHLCSFSSQYRGSLRSHYTVHSNERPYACDLCSYEAKRSYDLKKHKVFKHGKKHLASRSLFKNHSNSQYGKFNLKKCLNVPRLPEANRLCASEESVMPGLPSVLQSVGLSPVFPGSALADPSAQYPLLASMASAPPGLEAAEVPAPSPAPSPAVFPTFSHASSSQPNDGCLSPEEGTADKPRQRTSSESSSTSVVRVSIASPVAQTEHDAIPCQGSPITGSSQSATSTAGTTFISPINIYPSGYISEAVSATFASTSEAPYTFTRVPISRRKSRPMRQSDMISEEESSDLSVYNSPSQQPSSTTREACVGTRKAWHCPHCDILFLDSAIYFMHVGLHGNDDPWQCNLCNHHFYDVYSFTSHFINKHK